MYVNSIIHSASLTLCNAHTIGLRHTELEESQTTDEDSHISRSAYETTCLPLDFRNLELPQNSKHTLTVGECNVLMSILFLLSPAGDNACALKVKKVKIVK
jgi:hypothetical protein